MVSFKPIMYALSILILLGLVVPSLMSYFITFDTLPTNSMTSAVSDFIEAEFTVLTVDLNPFSWLGANFQSYLADTADYLALYPSWLIASILILTIMTFILTAIALIRGS